MKMFQSPSICRDLFDTKEFKFLSNMVRDDFGHKMVMVMVKKTFYEQKKILTGFRVSPIYKSMILLFCHDVVSIKNNGSMEIYDLPVIEDVEVSNIQFEFKEQI